MFLIYDTLSFGSFKGKKSSYDNTVFPICFHNYFIIKCSDFLYFPPPAYVLSVSKCVKFCLHSCNKFKYVKVMTLKQVSKRQNWRHVRMM